MEAGNNQQNDKLHQSGVHIEPWGKGDLPLLKKLLGDPVMTKYLGGPESDEQLTRRQDRYERLTESGKGWMSKIIHEATGEAIGSVGYWDSKHHGENIYEIGWSVLPGFQGKGIAGMAVPLAISRARSEGKYRFLHAFPSVENPSSNALCQKVGFTLIEQCEFEYPEGNIMQCNDWRIDLTADN